MRPGIHLSDTDESSVPFSSASPAGARLSTEGTYTAHLKGTRSSFKRVPKLIPPMQERGTCLMEKSRNGKQEFEVTTRRIGGFVD